MKIVLLALALCLAGCATWIPRGGSPAEAIRAHAREGERPARLTLHDGRELTLVSLAVQGDSVVGYTEAPRERVALPLADVARVAVRREEPAEQQEGAATGLLVAFTVAAALLAAVGLFVLRSR